MWLLGIRARPSIKMCQTIKWCLAFFLKIVCYFGFDFYIPFWFFIKQSALAKNFSFAKHLLYRQPVEFTRKDWDLIVDQVLSVLAPFEEATRDLSDHDASISITIPTVTTILDGLAVDGEVHGVQGLKRSVQASVNARFNAVEAYQLQVQWFHARGE